MLNGLDIFSGIAGNTLGLRPYIKTIAYCEQDRHAQAVLLSRMSDGSIDWAPIWDDITTLRAEHFDLPIDIIVGGFPCQDISVAGNGAGLEGKRSGLFFEIMRLAEEIRPTFLLIENVPAIRTRGLDTVVRTVSSLGYDCRWGMLSAGDVGANHVRERWFLLANAKDSHDRGRLRGLPQESSAVEGSKDQHKDTSELVVDSSPDAGVLADSSPEVSNSNVSGPERQRQESGRVGSQFCNTCNNSRWEVEPDVGRTFDGFSDRMDGVERNRTNAFQQEFEDSGSREVVSYVREGVVQESLWKTIRGLECFQAKEVLLSFVREFEAGGRVSRELLESEATPEGLLREMQNNRISPCPPLRRESAEQFFGEYPDAMRELSQLVASRSKSPRSSSLWEMSIPRVSSGVPFRLDRIKRLGNAVVPLQAREAFERLAGFKTKFCGSKKNKNQL